ncbi:uncharacterized protein [Phyllobates terribilis]|uniref:uncharacterized protein n=1 Tax=Phyllobates terribilis TaxID=111132 RepID=UPI003CCB6091
MEKKGLLPGNQQEIAVKRLAGNSSQGQEEFKTEIKLLAKLQHKNLVRLLGFSLHNKKRLLIYEFVPNASLDQFLFGANRRGHLEWENRYQIIRGIARGILYLQEDSRLRIIHRDIKASNVLLDAELCPKIADFGTARLFDIHQTHSDTRRIVGTYGYMAPEYALHGNFSTKSDVYSFGILLLEIVCGTRCSTLFTGEVSGSLINLVWRKWSEDRPLEVVDSSMIDGSEPEILRCIHIGLLCVQDNMAYRPTMSSIVRMMSSDYSIALPDPLQPAYVFMTSNLPLSSQDILSIDSSTGYESITELHKDT